MAEARSAVQTPTFKKAVKKLKANQKKELDKAVKELMALVSHENFYRDIKRHT